MQSNSQPICESCSPAATLSTCIAKRACSSLLRVGNGIIILLFLYLPSSTT
jgi:hypothetical protein